MKNALRPDLPPLPSRMRRLPVDARGYPVPWFVAWLDAAGNECRRGQGEPYFPAAPRTAFDLAIAEGICWVCGDRLGARRTFVIGPMCAVNLTTAEPPAHLDCAVFSARACPFLTRPKMRRVISEPVAPGMAIARNPGVCLLWTTRQWRTFDPGMGARGVLFELGPAESHAWYAEGRTATRAEVLESFETGIPILRAAAEVDGPEAVAEVEQRYRAALALVPPEAPT